MCSNYLFQTWHSCLYPKWISLLRNDNDTIGSGFLTSLNHDSISGYDGLVTYLEVIFKRIYKSVCTVMVIEFIVCPFRIRSNHAVVLAKVHCTKPPSMIILMLDKRFVHGEVPLFKHETKFSFFNLLSVWILS